MAEPEHTKHDVEIPRGAFFLLILFLIVLTVLWANVYLRVVWRA